MPIFSFDICTSCSIADPTSIYSSKRRGNTKPQPLSNGACVCCNTIRENEEYFTKSKFDGHLYSHDESCIVCGWNYLVNDDTHLNFAALYDDQWQCGDGSHKKELEEIIMKQAIAVSLMRMKSSESLLIAKTAGAVFDEMMKKHNVEENENEEDDDHGSVLSNETFGDNYYGEECGDEN